MPAHLSITWLCPHCGAKSTDSYDLGVGYLPPEACGNPGCPYLPVAVEASLTTTLAPEQRGGWDSS